MMQQCLGLKAGYPGTLLFCEDAEKAARLLDITLTHCNLDLTQTLRGELSPTLFALLDTCQTRMGSRLLRRWLLEPERAREAGQA
ncbi:mismatch repair ATPase MutS family [Serpentinimonas raichei]|jgi:DNA mismatch repair protein MutS|uniref:Mismatch repair ATPase MutS family n=1 Tax=Serpentinimonas raichei TaxID=1458425 RepID=A0A060NLD4_9BURK|nr:mismatch repair ATPase MutS family [Serpentinimonas raichei]